MPRWGDEPVTFDKADTLHSALAKLDRAGSGWPYVVIEPDCSLADNVLTYKLLARVSERFASPIAVVAGNPYWRRLAREHGLRAYGSVGSLRRARSRSFLALPESLVDALVSSFHLTLSPEGWVVTAVVLLSAGIAGFFLGPVMTVTIRTPVQVLNREMTVHVDVSSTALDVTSSTIPARSAETRFTVSDSVETTSEKNIGKERAKGEVTIINSSPGLVMLPAGTVLLAASGAKFTTTAEVVAGPFTQTGETTPVSAPAPVSSPTVGPTQAVAGSVLVTAVPAAPTAVPTAGTAPTPPTLIGVIVRVPAMAAEPGAKGNVPALAVSRTEADTFRGLTVFNEQPFTGGTEAKAKVASAEDRARLKESLYQKAQSQALSELASRVRPSESLIPHSLQLRMDREDYDKGVDEEADRLNGTLNVIATGVAFANQDLNALVEREWRDAMAKEYRALPGALNVAPPEVVEAGSRTAGLRVKVAGRVERMVEMGDLSQSLRGTSIQEARSRLAGLESPLRLEKLEIWPQWAPRAYRIEVQTIQ